MDEILEVAALRMLRLDDLGMRTGVAPDTVKAACDSIARALVAGYQSGAISWSRGDAIANHLYDLMISHCGGTVPDYAWDVFLAFDEGEIKGNGEAYTKARISEIERKYPMRP